MKLLSTQLRKSARLMLLAPMLPLLSKVRRLLYTSLHKAFESIVVSLSDLQLLPNPRSFPPVHPSPPPHPEERGSSLQGHDPVSIPQPHFLTTAQDLGEYPQHPFPTQAKEQQNRKVTL